MKTTTQSQFSVAPMDGVSKQLDFRVICLLFKNPDAPVLELAEACYRFTPQIAVRDGEAIFMDVGASRNLFSEESLLVRISALAQRFGCMPQIGIAEDAATAIAMARFASRDRGRLPVQALHYYANPFAQDEAIAKKMSYMSKSLRTLGIEDLDSFLKLPPRTLASRFGQEGLEAAMRVRGTLQATWPVFRFPEVIQEKMEFHDSAEISPCIGLDPLLFVLKSLADRAMARLRGRGLRASTIELELELDREAGLKSRKRPWRIELPVAQGSVSGLMPILRERLRFDLDRHPLAAAVLSVTFTVTETAPGHGSQKNLFNNNEEEAEAIDALVGRLRQRLGKDAAFRAAPVDRHLPERAWKRSLNAVPDLAPVMNEDFFEPPARPARVLKKPIAVRKDGDSLYREDRHWRVMEWHGPERISCEWWKDPKLSGYNRDYYRVVTDKGEQLWLFSVPSRPDFFLHGYFD
jgi:protein ImuB